MTAIDPIEKTVEGKMTNVSLFSALLPSQFIMTRLGSNPASPCTHNPNSARILAMKIETRK